MADDRSSLIGKVGLDVTDFKSGIAELNRSIRVVESGFKATAAGLGDWSKSATGLETRIKALNSEMELQGKKVSALRAEYKRVAAEKGETSRAAQELEIRLNKENETLGKMETELNQSKTALSEMSKETKEAGRGAEQLARDEDKAASSTGNLRASLEKLRDGVKSIASDFKELGDKVLKGVAIGIAGIATAVGVAVAGITKGVLKVAAAADDIVESSEKLGISVERYQELGFVAEQIGTDVESIGKAFARTTKAVNEASKAGSPAAKAFEELGINTRDASGELRDVEDIFGDIINALGEVENETQREILAQSLFSRSYQELIPLINLGADGLEEMTRQAHEMGAVMSEDAVTSLADLNDRVAAIKLGFRGLIGQLAGAFVPLMSEVADSLEKFLKSDEAKAGIAALVKGIESIVEAVRLLITGDFRDGIFGLTEDHPAITALLAIRETILSVFEVLRFLITGDFRGGIFGMFEDEAPLLALFAIRETIVELGQIIGTFIRDHWNELKGALIGIGAVLAASGVISIVAGIGAALATLASPIGAIIGAAALLGAAWTGNWFGIRDKTKEVIDVLVPKIQELIARSQELLSKIDWERLKEIAGGAFQAISDAVGSIDWERIGEAIRETFEAVGDVFASIDWETVGAAISGAFKSIADSVSGIDWAAIRDAIQGAFASIDWAAIGEAISGAFQAIGEAVSGIDWEAIGAVVTSVWNAISGAIGAAVDVIVGQTWPQLVAAFEEIKRVLTESGVDWEILGDILSGVGKVVGVAITGIGATIAVLLGVIVGTVNGIAGALNAMAGHFEALRARGTAIWDAIKQVIQGFADFFRAVIDQDFAAGVKALGSIFGGLVDLVKNMVGGIVEVFTGNFDAILAFVEGFVKGIIGFFQGLYDSLVGNSIIPDLVRDIAKTFLDFDWKKMAGDVIQGIKDGIHAGIDALIGEFEWLVGLLSKIKLPDWLTPGSPTPLEKALRGIADALDDVNKKGLKDFAAGLGKLELKPLQIQPGALAGAASGGGGVNNFYRYDVTQVFPDAGAAAIGMSVFESQRGNRLDGSMGVG